MLCAEPKEHKRFRPGTRPGGIGFPAGRIGDRGDREILYVPNVYVPFPAPIKGRKQKGRSCKRAVLANAPLFRFVSGGGPGEHPPKPRFWKPVPFASPPLEGTQ